MRRSPIRWGILTTGHIAGTFAKAVQVSKTGVLAAVAGRSLEKAQAFAREYRIPLAYGDYGSLLRDPQVEAVYIATPHPLHARWAIEAARMGKHILCEKPLTMTYRDASRVVQTARQHKVFLMEAFMYRCHPQTERLVELIQKKAIGEVRMIQASFCFERPLDLEHRLFNKKLGGGGIMDVGGYPASMSRLIAGAALGLPFAEPLEVKGSAVLGKKSGVDEWASAVLKFPGGILAELSCGIRIGRGVGVRVHGSKGNLTVPAPWKPGKDSFILLQRQGIPRVQKIVIRSQAPLYTLEADQAAACIRSGKGQSSAMTWADTLGNLKTLEAWRRSSGIS